MKVSKEIMDARVANVTWVAETRKRLSSLGWFMKCLKEPLARLANQQDECTGAFFEERFKSIAILDEESLLSVCAYIDLNPVAAGIASTFSFVFFLFRRQPPAKRFEVARFGVFRAKGPAIYLAQANGLGDTQTRD